MATISSGTTSSGQTIPSGTILTVAAGGTIENYIIASGGSTVIDGIDSGSTILSGGTELVLKGGTANAVTVQSGGALNISGAGFGSNLVIDGGSVVLQSPKAELTNGLTFVGAGTLIESAVISASGTTGAQAVISGFGTGDLIELTGIGTGAALTSAVVGDTTVLSVAGGSAETGFTETFTFAGTSQTFAMDTITGGGDVITATTTTTTSSPDITIASGVTSANLVVSSGDTLNVLAGGTITTADILAGGNATIIGNDSGSTIQAGGTETVGTAAIPGTVSGDAIYGTQIAIGSNSVLQNEVVYNGGTLDLFIKGATADGVTLETGAVLNMSGAAIASGLVINGGSVVLQSAKAELAGGLTFTGSGAVIESTVISASSTAGDQAVISGFGAGDTIALTAIGTGATMTSGTVGTNTVLSISGGTAQGAFVETFTFAGTSLNLEMTSISGGGDIIITTGTGTGTGTVTTSPTISLSVSGPTDLTNIGTGAIITGLTTSGGNEIMTISGGSSMGTNIEVVTFAGTGQYFGLNTDTAGTGETLTEIPILTSFTAGDIVVGMVGDVDDSADYGDNQGASVALEEIDPTTGKIIGEMILPQTTSVVNGVVENIFSGEYGSSSEGILELSGDGESLVIAGYGINAAAYNAAEVAGGINTYGTNALAQTTSLEGGPFTPVTRVIADIGYNGTIDTSTALLNVFNGNNPRSVATVNGQTFYIAGQGQSGDTTQGVFVVNDGSTAASALYTSTDARDVEIYNGNVYVSVNSKQGDVATVDEFSGEPGTTSTVIAPIALSGIGNSVALTAATENTVNASAVGTAVNLSPEQYFFANATTLYIADGGDPKGGGLGDGGLQKWVLNTGTGQWALAYTLSAGLNLVQDTGSAGTTGLIGLTGKLNADGTVTFYATNSTLGDLDQTYLYTITDTVNATTPASGASFTIITTAAPDTNVRGIAEAPSAPVAVTVASGQTSAGLTTSSGSTVTVQAGGTLSGAVILSGGVAFVSGTDGGSLIAAAGTETVFAGGTATADNVYGIQIVSGGASNETLYYGGIMEVAGSVSGLTVSGGMVTLDQAGVSLSGVTFAGTGEIAELTAGTSITGVISGFAAGDAIDLTQMGTASVLTSALSGGNTIETVTSGGISQSFTLAGTFAAGAISLTSDGNGGVEMAIISSGGGGTTSSGGTGSSNTVTVSSGITSANLTVSNGGTLSVLAGGTVTSPIVLSGGIANIAGLDTGAIISSGGIINLSPGAVETGATIMAGGSEILLGSVAISGDLVYGTQSENVSIAGSAILTNETIFAGGAVELMSKTYILENSTILSGGQLEITGNSTGENLVLSGGTINLGSPKSNLGGFVSFAAGGTIEQTSVFSAGAGGVFSLIEGFGAGDVIDIDLNGTGTDFSSSTSGADTVLTLVGGAAAGETFTFAGTSDSFTMLTITGSGSEILANTSVASSGNVAGGTIGAGGEQLVTNGGTITGGTITSGGVEIISSGGVASNTTIINGGTQTVLNGGTVSGASVEQNSTQILSAGATAINTTVGDPSSQTVSAGATASNTTVVDGGEQDVYGTAISTTVDTGGTEILFSGGTATESLINTGGTLVLDGGTATHTTLAPGATLIAETLGFEAGMTGTITGGELVVSDGGTALFSLALDGDYSQDVVHVSEAADGGTEVTLCFYQGTRIATPDGETAVEDLEAGDLVLTANGALPVRWVGQSTVATRFAAPW
jgi:autotransporter passenger strand-loop-strand repeat protein